MIRIWLAGAAVLIVAVGIAIVVWTDAPPEAPDGVPPEGPTAEPAPGPDAADELLAEPGPALGCEGAPAGAARELPEVIRPWATLACIDTVQMIFPTAGAQFAYVWRLDGNVFLLPSALERPRAPGAEGAWSYFNYVALRPLVDDLRPEAETLLADYTKHGGMTFDTAWQMVVRTNGGAEFDLYFFEQAGTLAALLICGADCALALDIDIETVAPE